MKRARQQRSAPKPPKVRNFVARSPLLRKGGAHGRSTAAQRRLDRIALAKTQGGDDALDD